MTDKEVDDGSFSLHQRSGTYYKMKLQCHTTSAAKRSIGQPRGKSALLKGKVEKRKRNPALNIYRNVSKTKIHYKCFPLGYYSSLRQF